MENLLSSYKDRLDQIGDVIQASDELVAFLEEEEDELFDELRNKFEPAIQDLHEEVAINHPLQIIAFEKELLDAKFEGLYLPRILGYSVLRGEVNERYKYYQPQNHFREIILTIVNSANFEILKKRIGQSLQIGFALSSKIWISHLLNDVTNKKVHTYLFNQILPKFQDLKERRVGLLRYQKQFESTHFRTAEFPETPEQMKLLYPGLHTFLLERVERYKDNTSFMYKVIQLLQNPKLQGSKEFTHLLAIVVNFYELNDNDQQTITQVINHLRSNDPSFQEDYFQFIIDILQGKTHLPNEGYQRVYKVLDGSIQDDLYKFYNLTNMVFSQGYIHEDTIQAVRAFYDMHEGLSTVNECLRLSILKSFGKLLYYLPEEDYSEYFELNKTFTTYMNIFVNQEFNQKLKEYSLNYIRKLLKKYTDKRGKDYQDIKKFVSSTFVELGFLNEKQVVEFF